MHFNLTIRLSRSNQAQNYLFLVHNSRVLVNKVFQLVYISFKSFPSTLSVAKVDQKAFTHEENRLFCLLKISPLRRKKACFFGFQLICILGNYQRSCGSIYCRSRWVIAIFTVGFIIHPKLDTSISVHRPLSFVTLVLPPLKF